MKDRQKVKRQVSPESELTFSTAGRLCITEVIVEQELNSNHHNDKVKGCCICTKCARVDFLSLFRQFLPIVIGTRGLCIQT
jgi:hypothetical protein